MFSQNSGSDLKSCQLIASDKSNLLKKIHFHPKSGFQVVAFFYLFGGRTTLLQLLETWFTNEHGSYFRDITKCLTGIYLQNIYLIGGVI